MAHVGEEGGLGAAGTFGGFALLDQLDLGFLQTGYINAAGDDALNGAVGITQRTPDRPYDGLPAVRPGHALFPENRLPGRPHPATVAFPPPDDLTAAYPAPTQIDRGVKG